MIAMALDQMDHEVDPFYFFDLVRSGRSYFDQGVFIWFPGFV